MSPGKNAGTIDSVVTIITGYGVPVQSERPFQPMKQVAMTWATVSIPFKADRMTVYFDAHSKESAEAGCHSSGALPSSQ
jgi:hypothetical protein